MGRFEGFDDIAARIEEFKPDVVGSGGYTATTPDAIEILRLAKAVNPKIVTLLGGIHTTFMWEEALRFHHDVIDYCLIGEAEQSAGQLLTSLNAGRPVDRVPGVAWWMDSHGTLPEGVSDAVLYPGNYDVDGYSGAKPVTAERRNGSGGRAVRSTAAAISHSLDDHSPAWDLINWEDYEFRPNPGSTLAVVTSSRGCVQQCSFCSQQLFYGRRWRARSAESFVAELKMLNRKFGVSVAMLSDEVPTLDPKRWRRILDLLIQEDPGVELLLETRVDDILRDEALIPRYREAGIVHIYVGVESGSQETLDHFKKKTNVDQNKRAIEIINAADIISETAFVLGMPGDTKESIQATVELAKMYQPDMAFFMAIAPWPYADIYNELKPRIRDFDYRNYNLVVPVVEPETMSQEALNKELFGAFHNFYMDKMHRLDALTPFKRDYMLSVFKLLAEHSYLKDHMKHMMPSAEMMAGHSAGNGAGMPESVKKMLAAH